MRTKTGLRIGAAAVGALSALAILPGGASAAFDGAHANQCANAGSIAGRGASFQRQAQLAWGAQQLAPDPGNAEANGFGYATTPQGGCSQFKLGGTKTITYEPKGSGDGRKAFGASTVAGEAGVRDTTIQFGGADEPPTTAQLDEANKGPDHVAGTADDAVLRTIPVAQSSVAVVVKLPAGCTVPASGRKISRETLDGAFNASVTVRTWGAVLPAITGAGCSDKPLTRVVRFDSSGTTFAFKNYLRAIAPSNWSTSLGNTAWPNDSGATAVVRPAVAGAGALLDTLSAQTNGGIGYADLASSRNRGYDSTTTTVSGNVVADPADATFWLSVQRKDLEYQSPALNDLKGTAATGSNCVNVSYSDPATGKLPTTTQSWSSVDGTATAADYPLCALTYALAWEDLSKAGINRAAGPDYTQDQARSVRDYLGYILNSSGGQAALAPNGYQALPSVDPSSGEPTANSVLAIAKAGQASLTWNKQPVVDPGTGGGDPDPGTGGNNGGNNGGGGGGTTVTPPVVTPPAVTPPVVQGKPVAPPAAATISLAKAAGAKGRALALTLSPSAAGKVSVVAVVGSGKKQVTVASGSATAKAAGALKLTLKPTSKGKKALKAGKTVKLTFKVTFTAANGSKTTVTKSLKVKITR